MKLHFARIAEAVGLASVVASLLIVAFQIQQANSIAIVATENEIRNNHAAFAESLLTNPELLEYLETMMEGSSRTWDESEGAERLRGFSYTVRAMDSWYAAETAYDEGMLTEETFAFIMEDVADTMNGFPGLHPAFLYLLESRPSLEGSQVAESIFLLIGN